jgi:hypothetical protein
VTSEAFRDPDDELRPNVDPRQVHVVVSPIELDIIVDALRSVGNTELAERMERILRQFGERH